MNRTRGLTLIELLVALALLSTISLLLAASVQGLRRATEGMLLRQKTLTEPETVLNDLVREVEGAWNPSFPNRPAFLLTQGAPMDPELWMWSFFTARPHLESDDPARFSLMEVTYSARRTDTGVELVRSERPAREPPAPFPPGQTKIHALRSMDVAAGSGEAWTETWPSDDRSSGLPRRVRIRIGTGGTPETTLSAEILIPCTMTISPSFQRAAAAP